MTLPLQTSAVQTEPLLQPVAEPKNNERIPVILHMWNTFLRWRFPVFGIIVASVVAGLILTILMTPLYTAKTRIEIAREEKNITNVQGLESRNAGQDLEFYNTQWSLLEAKSLAVRVARELRLARDKAFFAAHNTRPIEGSSLFAESSGPLSQGQRDKVERQVVDLLLAHINIVPIRGSSLVDITYTSASPEISARIANAWAQQFIASSMDRRMASTADAREFLENRLGDLRGKLQNSERDLANFANAHDIITLTRTIGPDGKTQVERTLAAANLENLDGALASATASRIQAESQLVGQRIGANSDVLNNVAIGQLRQQRAQVAADYAKLLDQFDPQYPAAQALHDQLASLDASIAREENRVVATRDTNYREAVEHEQRLRQQVDLLKGKLTQQQRDSIQYNIFQREVDTNRQLYESLLQRYKEIGVAAVGANNISIVDVAGVPEKPSSPKLVVNMALSLLFGALLSAALIYALSRMDETLRNPLQVNQLLNKPLLGSTPQTSDDVLDLLRDPKSELSEAYFSIRSNLAFLTDHGVPRSIMVTSSRAAEGKSITSAALAAVLGRTGKRVLLIDADMRSPSLNGFFGTTSEFGLSNILSGDDSWAKATVTTDWTGIDVLPSGPIPPNAAELLSSDRFSLLVAEYAARYDCVVVDSPPILGLADAPLISRAVEGCIFVTEAGGLPVRALKSSLNRLETAHAHLFGVVLTKIKTHTGGYGYGDGYGYGYGYGHGIDAAGTEA